MPDAHTPEQRSHNMSRIRNTGTTPERRLGELLRLMFPDEELGRTSQRLTGQARLLAARPSPRLVLRWMLLPQVPTAFHHAGKQPCLLGAEAGP